MNLPTLPDQRAAQNGTGVCLADERSTLTNDEFAQQVSSYAVQLSRLGVVPGSVVAVQLRNRVELIVVLFAGWRLGAVVTPVDPNLTDFETAHQLRDSGAAVFLVAAPQVLECIPGVVAATRYRLADTQLLPDQALPAHRYLSVYQLDTPDLAATSQRLGQALGDGTLDMSEAIALGGPTGAELLFYTPIG